MSVLELLFESLWAIPRGHFLKSLLSDLVLFGISRAKTINQNSADFCSVASFGPSLSEALHIFA